MKPLNPAAFPRPYSTSTVPLDIENLAQDGMSMRDYFAAKALQGLIIANPEWGKKPGSDKRFAEISYHLADAMMEKRSEDENHQRD